MSKDLYVWSTYVSLTLMRESSDIECEHCGEELFELDGSFHCPSCDSISGFELVPDSEQFTL